MLILEKNGYRYFEAGLVAVGISGYYRFAVVLVLVLEQVERLADCKSFAVELVGMEGYCMIAEA